MSDLVERLRDDGELINKLAQESGWNSCYEAADEIERLTAIEKAARALFESPTKFYWVSPKTWYAHEPEESSDA